MDSTRLYARLERLSELFRVDLRLTGNNLGLLPVQIEALHYLSVCNRFSDTPMAVSEYLGQTKGTVSQTLKVLEKKDLLRKQVDPDDKRVTHLKLTRQGDELLQQLLPTPMLKNVGRGLSEDQESRIVSALDELISALLRGNGMKSFGVCKTCRFNRSEPGGAFFCELVKQPLSLADIEQWCREHEEPDEVH